MKNNQIKPKIKLKNQKKKIPPSNKKILPLGIKKGEDFIEKKSQNSKTRNKKNKNGSLSVKKNKHGKKNENKCC